MYRSKSWRVKKVIKRGKFEVMGKWLSRARLNFFLPSCLCVPCPEALSWWASGWAWSGWIFFFLPACPRIVLKLCSWWANGWAESGWIFSSFLLDRECAVVVPFWLFLRWELVPDRTMCFTSSVGGGLSWRHVFQGPILPQTQFLSLCGLRCPSERVSFSLLGNEWATDGLENLLGVGGPECPWKKCREKNFFALFFKKSGGPFTSIGL